MGPGQLSLGEVCIIGFTKGCPGILTKGCPGNPRTGLSCPKRAPLTCLLPLQAKQMQDFTTPEIMRVPLQQLCLQIKILGLGEVR